MTLGEIIRDKGNEVYYIAPGVTLAAVVDALVEFNCGSLIVLDGEKMVGIITERDILRACSSRRNALEEQLVDDHMTRDVIVGKPSDAVENTMGLMTKHRVRHLPVMEEGNLVGIISIGDVVKIQHDRLTMENHYLKSYIQTDGAATLGSV